MALTHHALLDQLEHAVEQRLREMLSPRPGLAQRLGQVQVEFFHRQAAVGQQPSGEVVLAQLAADLLVEGLGERGVVRFGQGQPRRHGMATELADQLRMARGHRIERVADVKPRHGARRALEHAVAGIGESDGRAVVPLLEARGEDANDALVPLCIEQAQAIGHRLDRQVPQLGQRLALHALFDGLAVLVQAVQLLGHVQRQGRILAEQALDTQAHVVQAPSGVQPRAQNETQVGGGDASVVALGHLQNRLEARPGAPGTNTLQPLMHEDTVVGVQRHHVGHAAQGHQVQQFADVRLREGVVAAQAAQARAQGHEDVEHHPDACQRLAGKRAAWLVGVDDGIGVRQRLARQVVVGHQYLEASRLRRRDAVDAGNPIVDRDQQLRLALQCHFDDFRCEAVPVLETVGYQVVHVGCTEQAQTQHADGTGRSAIGIEVTDDQNALALIDGLHQQVDARVDALELLVGQQARQTLVQLGLALHATGGVQARQQGWQVAKKRQGRGQRARFDTHGKVQPRSPSSHCNCTSCWPRSSVTNTVPSLIITSHLMLRGMSVARVSSTS